MANVLLRVLKCEQARLEQAAATEIRIALVMHFQGKTHLSPLLQQCQSQHSALLLRGCCSACMSRGSELLFEAWSFSCSVEFG